MLTNPSAIEQKYPQNELKRLQPAITTKYSKKIACRASEAKSQARLENPVSAGGLLCIQWLYVDVSSTLDVRSFIWDSEKALKNAREHGIRFEQAREAFLDPLARYEDASPDQEARQACIGLTTDYRLLYVVHVVREGDVLRLISARLAEVAERRRYEND